VPEFHGLARTLQAFLENPARSIQKFDGATEVSDFLLLWSQLDWHRLSAGPPAVVRQLPAITFLALDRKACQLAELLKSAPSVATPQVFDQVNESAVSPAGETDEDLVCERKRGWIATAVNRASHPAALCRLQPSGNQEVPDGDAR